MKKICLLILLLVLSACARPTPPAHVDIAAAEKIWQNFLSAGKDLEGIPQRVSLSLRFGTSGDTRRVTALVWGNAGKAGDKAVRLDVMAGIGALVACVLDDSNKFLVYSPREDKAFSHDGENKPLLKVGVPVPFNLPQLFAIVCGRTDEAFGNSYSSAESQENGRLSFELTGRPGGRLTVDEKGRPVHWAENGKKGWQMELAYEDDGEVATADPGHGFLPHKLRLSHASGKKAIVLIKEREKATSAFGKKQMSLKIPNGIKILPLSEYSPE